MASLSSDVQKTMPYFNSRCLGWHRQSLFRLIASLQAKRIQSLRSVFGERYPDPVRVLSVGQDVSTISYVSVHTIVPSHARHLSELFLNT